MDPAPDPIATSEVVVELSESRVKATTELLGSRTTVGRVAKALPKRLLVTPVVDVLTAPPVL